VSHVVSILDPGASVPAAAFAPDEHLELRFHDIIDVHPEMQCPHREHIERLLHFIHNMNRPAKVHLLLHCHAGFSRSAAVAILILASLLPKLSAADLADELLRLRRRNLD
jgi:predicted protein tyrosine phosphatase